MHAFYHLNISLGENLLSKEESHHLLKVLRLKEGEEIFLLDGCGIIAKAELIGKEGSLAKARVLSIDHSDILQPEISLYISPPKSSDRLDFIIEKATELGVSTFIFLHCRNSERKNIRLDKIEQKIQAACKQSLRAHFPKVIDMTPLSSLTLVAESQNLLFHCQDHMDRQEIEDIKIADKLGLFIGPEGDFSKDEVLHLVEQGLHSTSLGEQRLRTETAVLSAIVKSQTLHKLQRR